METINKSSIINFKNLTVVVIAALAVYFLVTTLVENRLQVIEQYTVEKISKQQSLLSAIAETTARNGADPITESIVRDCALEERIEFEDLLGRLNEGLYVSQLIELERLFGRCGSFYSERKSVMVSRLSREIEIFEDYVNQLNVINDKNNNQTYQVEQWKMLSKEEQRQSELFAELVVMQDKIITTLLSGKSATSPEILEILQEVSEVQQSLIVASKQAATIRSELVPL